MRTKRAASAEPAKAAPPPAVRRLLSGLSTEELEPIAVEVIREHRQRLQLSQELFETLERKEEERATAAELSQLRRDYRLATLYLHGQHQLVSLVVAALGYVPDVDSQPSDEASLTR